MKKQKLKGQVPKPRATEVNRVLRERVGGAHEPKSGDRMKRSRRAEETRRIIDESSQ